MRANNCSSCLYTSSQWQAMQSRVVEVKGDHRPGNSTFDRVALAPPPLQPRFEISPQRLFGRRWPKTPPLERSGSRLGGRGGESGGGKA